MVYYSNWNNGVRLSKFICFLHKDIDLNKQLDDTPIGFYDFLLLYNAESVIDMLFIDIEGSEFAIFHLLAGTRLLYYVWFS